MSKKILPIMFGLFVVTVSCAEASPWNKLTRLTVNETFQVPGATLTPGEYVVKLADSQANRHIVQFYNEDQSKLITTTLAINDSIMEPEGETQLRFYETTGNEPPALRTWFYPGDSFGQEFVYPKEQARAIAKMSDRNVPAMDDNAAKELKTRSGSQAGAAPTYVETTRIYVWSPQDREVSTASANAENARKDREPAWREGQKKYARHGRFHHTDNLSSTRQSGKALPDHYTSQMSNVDAVMRRIEQHGDAFEEDFKNAINSSTIAVEDRDDMIARVDRLEDTLDDLQKEFNNGDTAKTHEHLRRALEIGAGINRFMLRSDFGGAEDSWSAVRTDLNQLAQAHVYPALQQHGVHAENTATR